MNTKYVFCEVGIEHLFVLHNAVAWFRQLIAGQSPPNLAFVSGALRGRFVVGPKCHCNIFFSEHFNVFLSVSFRHYPILVSVLFYSLKKDERTKHGNIQMEQCSDIGELLTENCFDIMGF